ncbi:MAG: phospholipase D-like domain-containing protein [Shewanella xiamenensis]|nr:phospholipase D-like domain-containing protein [Shewanella xiamenensis]
MTEEDATHLAFQISESINHYLFNHVRPSNESVLVTELIPCELRSHAILNIGWDALHRLKNESNLDVMEVDFITTLPAQFRLTSEANQLRNDTGIWGGSLLSSIAEIINSAKHELYVIAPYWSINGVKALISSLDRLEKPELKVRILTQPAEKLNHEELKAVSHLKEFFLGLKTNFKILAPTMENSFTPLIHAKSVIADGRDAYIGSANYTASGIEHSIEIGARFKGDGVRPLLVWAKYLENVLEDWSVSC